ncbi:MAG: phosphate ABC transporter substrate-binding protein [Peptostreptococcaceae bacterium]|nr:phosphate ABC transporter substrate-binding protein [Peptostreptococcaceae bacterium]
MFKKKVLALLSSTILVAGLAVGCGSNSGVDAKSDKETKVTVSGSTSVGSPMEKLAEAFEGKNSGVKVEVQQLGSSAGIKNAIEGVSEIGMSSRDLKDEEKSSGLKETIIATDGIAVITNKANKVTDLTLDQVKDIYTGKITNWKEVGGEDAPIVVVSREDGSGTRDGFQEKVGFESEELIKDAQISDGSGNIKSTVEGNVNAIGYISFGYVDEAVNAVKVDGVEINHETVANNEYVIARPFILVNKDGISDNAQALIDFILSDEGQSILEEKGFIRVK